MTIGSLDLKVRPVKIGFLVSPADKSSVEKAIHLNSLLWGGMFNPLIPSYKNLPKNWEEHKSKRTTASKVVTGYIEGFDPDYLVNLSEVQAGSIGFDEERIVTYEEVISSFDEDMAPSVGAGIFEVVRQFKHDEMRFIRRNEYKFVNPRLADKNKLFTASVFGDMKGYGDSLFNQYLRGVIVTQADVDISNYCNYIAPDYLYPRRMGALYLDQRISGVAVFYMDATKTIDVIDYWNLRAAGWSVLPVAKQSENEEIVQQKCKEFIEYAYTPYRHNKEMYFRASMIKSRNTTLKEMTDFNKKLGMTPDPKKGSKVVLQRWYPRIWDEWARENTQEVITPVYCKEKEIQLQEDQTKHSFKTLDPDFELSHVNSNHPRFAIEVDSKIYGSKELLAEVIPRGGENLSRAIGKISLDKWRISKSGPVYLPNHKNSTVYYEVPLAEPVMVAWFKERGWKVNISPSGKVAKQMIKQLDGVFGVNQLRREKLIKLLQELSNNGFINERDFRSKIAQITNSDDVWVTRDEYIKGLLEREIFQLGVELKCPVCTQRSWYSLNEVAFNVRCTSCLTDYKIQSIDLSDKKWAYKSFGTFGLPKQAFGAYSVLLTLLFLTKDHLERTTSLLSFTANNNGKEIEADLCVVREKQFGDYSSQEVLLCECKTYNKFEKKDIDRMRLLAKEFPGATLVFSTLRTELTATEKRILRPLVNNGRRYWKAEKIYNPVLILTGNELFSSRDIPYCWEGMTGKAGEIAAMNVHPRKLSEIADATQQIYLDMRPYHEYRVEQIKRRQKVV